MHITHIARCSLPFKPSVTTWRGRAGSMAPPPGKTPLDDCSPTISRNSLRLARLWATVTSMRLQSSPLQRRAALTCPKCGFEQEDGSECLRCGIIFSKFKTPAPAVEKARAGHSRRYRVTASDSRTLVSGVSYSPVDLPNTQHRRAAADPTPNTAAFHSNRPVASRSCGREDGPATKGLAGEPTSRSNP
jgi:hypothetical protein